VKGKEVVFYGDCYRCGKNGHSAKFCPTYGQGETKGKNWDTTKSMGDAHYEPGVEADSEGLAAPPGLDEDDLEDLEALLPPGLCDHLMDDYPPPGLSEMDFPSYSRAADFTEMSKATEAFAAANQAAMALPIIPDGYQVLLRSVPADLACVPVIRALLEQAGLLEDLVGISSRLGGKVLVVYSSMERVNPCLQHFNGRRLGGSETPCTALYVKTVKRVPDTVPNITSVAHLAQYFAANSSWFGDFGGADWAGDKFCSANGKPESEAEPIDASVRKLSADAHEFVPATVTESNVQAPGESSAMSADASEFVPMWLEKKGVVRSFDSDASTDVCPTSEKASEGNESE